MLTKKTKNKLQKPLLSSFGFLICVLFSHHSHSENARSDYDLDDDGLIEINDLGDLNEIRNDLTGASLYGESTGCPDSGCYGFELTTNLDFDTNQDHVIDSNDDYFFTHAQGGGWLPLAQDSDEFSATFDGNGYKILNLYINWTSGNASLFGKLNNAQILNLGLTGPLMSVTSLNATVSAISHNVSNSLIKNTYNTGLITGNRAAGIINSAYDTNIHNCFNTGHITADNSDSAGIVNYLSRGEIFNSFNTGPIKIRLTSLDYAAGIVSDSRNSKIANVFSTGYAYGDTNRLYGLVGYSYNDTFANMYWATDATAQANSNYSSISRQYIGLPLATLQCATQANTDGFNSACVSTNGSAEGLNAGVILFNTWDTATDNDQLLWDFGSDSELPGLILNGVTYRDSDGDGSLDEYDHWPQNSAAWQDEDLDGYPDQWSFFCDTDCQATSGLVLDHFPETSEAWQDDDLDGLPESFHTDCDASCQTNSSLTLDSHPNDFDNDGITDNVDSDDNGDSIADIDADSNGLIDVATMSQLNSIRYQVNGHGYRETDTSELDPSGCPVRIVEGKASRTCFGYELTQDLDFDTNGNGEIDSGDEFWNEEDGVGLGWQPINNYFSSSHGFTSVFDGNGHVIRNLYINNASLFSAGLFKRIDGGTVKNLGMTGPLASIFASSSAAAIAGVGHNCTIENVFNTINIHARGSNVGGIASQLGQCVVKNVFNTGNLENGDRDIGGIASRMSSNSQIMNAFNTGHITSLSSQAGIISYFSTESTVNNAYWGNGEGGQTYSSRASESQSYVGVTKSTLQCATQANTHHENSNCVSEDGAAEGLNNPLTLYNEWDLARFNGQPLWDFGSSTQLPGFNFNGTIYRDSDGDGSLDEDDSWPNDPAASRDDDEDGYPDAWSLGCLDSCLSETSLILDAFPQNKAAWQDDDQDGFPDNWATNCDATCQNDSGLTIDPFTDDTDNDGSSNDVDNDDNNDGITDADANSNGLIEVSSLAQLNAMRFQLDGAGLRLEADGELNTSGCPFVIHKGVTTQRCHGYELTQDLNFDTNLDDVMDENDDYWNEGQGWTPIGEYNQPFRAVFNANYHTIYNLYSKQTSNQAGLFGYTTLAEIHNLAITGPLASIQGRGNTGSILGYGRFTLISNSYNTAPVISTYSNTGGLAGTLISGNIIKSFNTGQVNSSEGYAGGLIGNSSASNIENSFNTAAVISSANFTAGLVGFGSHTNISNSFSTGYVSTISPAGISAYAYQSDIKNTYWAIDLSGTATSSTSNESNSFLGVNGSVLQCATSANTTSDNSNCLSSDYASEGFKNPITLFNTWDSNHWDFGDNTQFPGLIINATIYRDSDGDGTLDSDDIWPNNRAASYDEDRDGYPDTWSIGCDDMCIATSGLSLDQFPESSAAWKDEDLDGLPDNWSNTCDATCQTDSGFTLDAHPNDSDNDGNINSIDDDDNNDGITDADADSDGLIDIATLAQLNAIRFQLDGAGLRLEEAGPLNNSGCPFVIYQGSYTQRCHGYELSNHLDFDTNQDGLMDSNDDYWNEHNDIGQGWLPIGYEFTATFEGNGFSIKNLYINQTSNGLGLFNRLRNAHVRNLAFTGALSQINGSGTIGSIAGSTRFSIIENVFSAIDIQGNGRNIGGIIGSSNSSTLRNLMNTGSISSTDHEIGGLIGDLNSSTLENGFNTGKVNANVSRIGAIIGNLYNSSVTNTYWAIDSSTQNRGRYESEANSYLGVSLSTLACATQANTNFSNSDCVSSDGSAEGLKNPATLFNQWDQALLQGQPIWNFGNNQQLPALSLNGMLYRDSDGDGLIDENDANPYDTDNDGLTNKDDAYPFISLDGRPDTDNDGRPDDCNNACQTLGMSEDLDDDNDGIADNNDTFPTISLGDRVDTDGDGIPNQCDQACLLLGMNEDTDDDNDGITDINDAFPLVSIGELLDTDGDGAPDSCDVSCEALGMSADLDDDNDGVADINDPHLGNDNGAPEITMGPANFSESVSTENGTHFAWIIEEMFFTQFSTYDEVDNQFTYEAQLNGQQLNVAAGQTTLIPAGLQSIHWMAVDTSGNKSAPFIQTIKVYPQVQFTEAISESGEDYHAKVELSLTGDSPEYPVLVNIKANATSDIDQNDLDSSFNLNDIQQVAIELNEDNQAVGYLVIPVIDDNTSENDELLILDIIGTEVKENENNYFAVNNQQQVHQLLITFRNLAPTVELLLEQNGTAIDSIQHDGGEVTITALIDDRNGSDTHTVSWNIEELGISETSDTQIRFDPIDFAAGVYTLSIIVTDDGSPALSGQAEISIEVIAPEPVVESREESSNSSGGGGGSLPLWMLMLSAYFIFSTHRKRFKRA